MSQAGEVSSRVADGQLRQSGRAFLLDLYTRSGVSSSIRSRTPPFRRRWTISTTRGRALLAVESELELRLAGDFIFVNATRLRLELDNYASFSHILTILRAFDIGALRIAPGVNRREWQIFLSLLLSLSERAEPDTRFDELNERLDAGNVHGIRRARHAPGAPNPRSSVRRPSGCTRRAWPSRKM